jgi:hypothetical protein
MPPDIEKTKNKYSKIIIVFKTLIGVIIFVLALSFLIYKSGNLLISWAGVSDSVESRGYLNGDADSVSEGDAEIVKTVEKISRHATGTLESLAISSTSSTVAPYSDIQYVILSFDGSRSLSMWNETRQFAKDMTAKGKPVHFTYFINPIYLITKSTAKNVYRPPRAQMGASLIGYADSEQDVKNRVEQINLAYSEGNEIGSHNVGHYNGSKWSHDEWLQESNSFDSIIMNVQKNNPNVVIPPWNFNISEFVGFRAPELGVNSNLYKVLSEKKYLYDTSGMRMPTKYPTKDKNGIWHIGLGIIKAPDLHSKLNNPDASNKSSYVLSMDYNFWMMQSNVRNTAKKGTPLWNSFFGEMKDAYLGYFNKNYEGNHAPVVIGHHFSTWNDGVYWEVMKSFAEDVCGKPKVKCVTFKEYVDYLNSVAK